jgi:hypothetical protein
MVDRLPCAVVLACLMQYGRLHSVAQEGGAAERRHLNSLYVQSQFGE